MREVLFQYYIDPTTWVYLSAMMIIGIFFKFRRFWSVRNLDLLGIIAFGPGLLLVANGQTLPGYFWLFFLETAWIVRLLLDTVMVRRPLLEPNLSIDGLTFTAMALLFFVAVNLFTIPLADSDANVAVQIDQILAGETTSAELTQIDTLAPGYPTFQALATFSNNAFQPNNPADAPTLPERAARRATISQILIILAQLAIVLGLVLVGYAHFDNLHTSAAVAALYLLLPYSSQITARVDHLVPAAFLVWMIVTYRRPVFSGLFLGVAIGLIWYPIFLLPLWISFYWRRGLGRFAIGTLAALVVMILTLSLISYDAASFLTLLERMFGAGVFSLETKSGFWSFHDPVYRIPVLVAFLIVIGSMSLWPSQKNLGTLLSCSTTVMLGILFWYDPGDGIYHMAWFLPLLLLTIFRPNLEDRVALTAVR